MFKMYEFHWKGKNRFGQIQRGKMLAENREEVETRLVKRGFLNFNIRRNFIFPQNPKQDEITQMLNQLALLLRSSIPLKSALTMIMANCLNIKSYLWLKSLITLLESGFAFSDALEKEGKYLASQEIQLIKIGEKTGTLATILTNIAASRHKTEKLVKKVKKIMFYPVMILMISITLSILLLIFIVPKFAELYGAKEKSLPFITELLFTLSRFLQNSLIEISLFAIIIVFSLYYLNRKTAIIRQCKFILLHKIPVFNQIITHHRIIFFSQNCALMLKSKLRLDSTLNAFLHGKNHDPILTKEIEFSLQVLKQGYSLSEGLNPNYFSDEMIQMIAIAEKSANLAPMLEHISEIYQQKLDYQIDLLAQLLEPMLMLIMGIIVGTILIGLYLPIFDMGAMIE